MSGDTQVRTLAKAGKYLSFMLGEEEYGIDILRIQEIIGLMGVTAVPRAPEAVRGVINLRGRVIPVIDLRCQFGMTSVEDTEKTCVVVVQVRMGETVLTVGVIVDEVSEVLKIDSDQIDLPPSFGVSLDAEFITGMGKHGKKVLIMVDIDSVLNCNELGAMALDMQPV